MIISSLILLSSYVGLSDTVSLTCLLGSMSQMLVKKSAPWDSLFVS